MAIIYSIIISLLQYSDSTNIETHLQGKWLAEISNGYVLFLDFKENQILTAGVIGNANGPLEIDKIEGKWNLDKKILELQLPDLMQKLEIEKNYQDSIVFKQDILNEISIKKLVKIFNTGMEFQWDLEKELIGHQMIDSNQNFYEFINGKEFRFSKCGAREHSQNNNWFILDFEGVKLLSLGEYAWFADRIIFIPIEKTNHRIRFQYFYKSKICDFELIENMK